MDNVSKTDLYIIKKKYGEKMMHLCRNLFPSMLEKPGLLSNLILNHFEPSRFLYDDIIQTNSVDDFKNYIYSFMENDKKIDFDIKKTPSELLSDAGYYLYECKNEEEIQEFRKYYKKGEELCTFNGNRLKRCYVFFAVKKNVDEIKREDFVNPSREDEYGTSVISIQFTRGKGNTLSIKNRYNHTVDNPDATFSNNLEKIIPGLTKSFERKYNLNLHSSRCNLELPGYVKASDGKFYKYNYEINNIYYCPNNIIIDNFECIDKYSKESERYIVLDYFIIDLKDKTIRLYDKNIKDCFIDELENINHINITKSKDTSYKTIEIFYGCNKKAIIAIDKTNKITKYHNEHLTDTKKPFLRFNKVLSILNTPNLEMIGNGFLYSNENLTSLYLPKLTVVGNGFLRSNHQLNIVELSNLEKIGNSFLYYNNCLTSLYLPKLTVVGNGFLYSNRLLEELGMLSLERVGDDFLRSNNCLIDLYLPKLRMLGNNFLYYNKTLRYLNTPNLEVINSSLLKFNNILISFDSKLDINRCCIDNKTVYKALLSSTLKELLAKHNIQVEGYRKK